MGGYGKFGFGMNALGNILRAAINSGFTGMADASAAQAALSQRQRRLLAQIEAEEATDLAKIRLIQAQKHLREHGVPGFDILGDIKKPPRQLSGSDTQTGALALAITFSALAAAGIDYITDGAIQRLIQGDSTITVGYKIDQNGVLTPVRQTITDAKIYQTNPDSTAARVTLAKQIEELNQLKAQEEYMRKHYPQQAPTTPALEGTSKPKKRRKKKGSEGQT